MNKDELNSKILELASNLAHNAAKDEMFKEEIIIDESEMYIEKENDGTIYTDVAQEIFNRWYDYFDSQIREVFKSVELEQIELPKRIQLLSPDGFTFDVEGKTYDTIEDAREALNEFLKRFEHQGYYSTIIDNKRVRLPLDEVVRFCKFKEV